MSPADCKELIKPLERIARSLEELVRRTPSEHDRTKTALLVALLTNAGLPPTIIQSERWTKDLLQSFNHGSPPGAAGRRRRS